MNKLIKKIAQNSLYIIILNTLINCPSVKAQFPSVGCYMIDEFGGIIDLSSLCSFSVNQRLSNNNQDTQPPSPNQSSQGNESPANKRNSSALPGGNNTNTSTSGTQNTAQQERDRSQLPIIRRTIPIIDQQQQQIEESTQNKK
jgi:hypothetical protein